MDLWGTHLNCVHRERGLLKAENQLNSTGLAFELFSSTSQLTIDHRPHQTHQEYQRHQKHQRPDSNGQAFGVTLNAFKPCSSQVNRIRQRRTGVPERTILVKRATSLWRAILVKRAILVERESHSVWNRRSSFEARGNRMFWLSLCDYIKPSWAIWTYQMRKVICFRTAASTTWKCRKFLLETYFGPIFRVRSFSINWSADRFSDKRRSSRDVLSYFLAGMLSGIVTPFSLQRLRLAIYSRKMVKYFAKSDLAFSV